MCVVRCVGMGVSEQIHDLGRFDKHACDLTASLSRLAEVLDAINLAVGPLQVFGSDLLGLVQLQSDIVAFAELGHRPKVEHRASGLLAIGERDDTADAAVERRAEGRLGGA